MKSKTLILPVSDKGGDFIVIPGQLDVDIRKKHVIITGPSLLSTTIVSYKRASPGEMRHSRDASLKRIQLDTKAKTPHQEYEGLLTTTRLIGSEEDKDIETLAE
ncbi:unnamed protein product [Angiostrongylus costaricensis]|uniref:Arrestin_C domain-containing protein n=1 Tax=Angiostrongylus costaricensis TaxID=334426 RepID=A0A0R3PZ64_ANGCS|nr:unnamed protein product [Angiostrongylus costaricensis]